MVAGHVVLAAFTGMAMSMDGHSINAVAVVPVYFMSVAISLLEVFVAFLQAYVFTLLSSVFLGAFIHPDH
jgi:F-type H+-transporting ATPase subunit a